MTEPININFNMLQDGSTLQENPGTIYSSLWPSLNSARSTEPLLGRTRNIQKLHRHVGAFLDGQEWLWHDLRNASQKHRDFVLMDNPRFRLKRFVVTDPDEYIAAVRRHLQAYLRLVEEYTGVTS